MKRLYILLIFVFGFKNNYAQKYQPFDTNMVWKVFQTGSASYYGSGGSCYRADSYNYFVKGYIFNNGINWHKVYANVLQCSSYSGNNCNASFTPTNSVQFIGMFSNDTISKKVYFVPTPTLTSNFTPNDNNLIFNSNNKTIGDTMFVYSGGNPSYKILTYKITQIDSVLLGIKYHKIFLGVTTNTYNYSPNYAHFIEGVGSDEGIFDSRFSALSGWSSKLGCFSNTSYTKYFAGLNFCSVSIQAYPNALRDTTVCFNGLPAGINNNSLQTYDIKIYPNPATNLLNIKIETEHAESVTIKIIDVTGKLMLQQNYTNNCSINIQNLDNGIYFINLVQPNKVISTKKIVVMK